MLLENNTLSNCNYALMIVWARESWYKKKDGTLDNMQMRGNVMDNFTMYLILLNKRKSIVFFFFLDFDNEPKNLRNGLATIGILNTYGNLNSKHSLWLTKTKNSELS
ncbi:hypothetical protein CR513_55928, partial [Mucuna pruriens]